MGFNKHGLSRHIPADIARAVRLRCGFGCARCGVTIYEYEHFFPDFADAAVHDADQIVLLCPTCHGLVTKGVFPKEMVAEASLNPKAKSQGFSSQALPFFKGLPSLKIGGGGLVENTPIPIEVFGNPLIRFDPAEDGSEVARISVNISDAFGESCLEVKENEWRVLSGAWDFEWRGTRYIFRDSQGVIFLSLDLRPSDSTIIVETLKTSVNGVPIHITENSMEFGGARFSGCVANGCQVGFAFG